jgi:hypothetical protein
MTGGLKATASRLAITALFCAIGATVFAQKPAKAADLGGDCCADLEERVAELEATTVRKGNKKVSVQIYGKMNRAVAFWDDGGEQNTYVVNNYNESTRTGIKGTTKIGGDWTAGYRIEWEYREAASSRLNQFDDNNANDPTIAVRWSQMFVTNKTYGTLNWGLTATPKYDITKTGMEYISTLPGEGGGLSDTMTADFRMNSNFRLRPTGFNNAEGLSTLTWSNISRCYSSSDSFNCSTRRNGVSYVSPEWQGFTASYGYFEDDDWGAALRYKNTFADTWMVAGGVAYENLRDERLQSGGGGEATGVVPIPQPNGSVANKTTFFERNFDEWAGSLAVKHKPTGLFATGIFSTSTTDDTNAVGFYTGTRAPDMSAWDVQAGIQRKMLGLGAFGETAFWGGYAEVHDGFGQASNGNGGSLGIPANGVLKPGTFVNIGVPVQMTGSEVNRWFLAFDQDFASAAFHLYAVYQHFTADLDLVTRDLSVSPKGKLKAIGESIDDFDVFYTGGRLYF